jgi:hypothetical protein
VDELQAHRDERARHNKALLDRLCERLGVEDYTSIGPRVDDLLAKLEETGACLVAESHARARDFDAHCRSLAAYREVVEAAKRVVASPLNDTQTMRSLAAALSRLTPTTEGTKDG